MNSPGAPARGDSTFPTRLHIPVLLQESVDALNLAAEAVVVDATLGEGGHAREILRRLGEKGRVVGIEIDRRMIESLDLADRRLTVVEGNFRDTARILKSLEIDRGDAVLADLGVSARHYREAGWGFSFSADGPLDMRLDPNGPTAKEIVNAWPEERLSRWLYDAGLKDARRLAARIVKERQTAPLERTTDLARIFGSGGWRKGRKVSHPATGVFRAIREAVTGELEHLRIFLSGAGEVLKPGGRLAVLTYTFGEERIVRVEGDRLVKGCICPPKFPVCRCGIKPSFRWVNRKGVRPGDEEVQTNPSARSARLFVMEKI